VRGCQLPDWTYVFHKCTVSKSFVFTLHIRTVETGKLSGKGNRNRGPAGELGQHGIAYLEGDILMHTLQPSLELVVSPGTVDPVNRREMLTFSPCQALLSSKLPCLVA
jgi:hypothetical protein